MIESITIISRSGKGNIDIGMDGHQEYWLESVDWGQVEGSHLDYTYYNQVGSSIVSTRLLTRPLSIQGWVIEDTTPLATRCNFLNRYISPTEDYILQYGDYQIPFRPDSSIHYGREHTTNNVKMRHFLIQATCPFPLFTKTVATIVPFDFGSSKFKFPTDFGQSGNFVFATTEKIFNTTIDNPGGFPTGVTIQISFKGTVRNPRIVDLKTSELIGVNQTFVTGDTLTLTTSPGNKTMVLRNSAGKVTNVIRHRNVKTTWLQLQPGSNVWSIDCDDLTQREAMEVTVSFTPLYLEVE